MQVYSQYGIYLIPPPHLTYPLSLGHQVLANEFRTLTGGKFMVHCTVKGFFKLIAGATPQDFLPQLDALFANTPAFGTEITDLYAHIEGRWGPGVALVLHKSAAFQQLHDAVWEIVQPYIASDCHFSAVEAAGPNFRPHLTLAMADLPTEAGLFEQVKALCQYIYVNLPNTSWLAQDMQLIEFNSTDWDGQWWDSLDYRQIKGWQLTEKEQV